MTMTVRQLNRATLARQLLLERSPMTVTAALEHLVGLQAQAPLAPYVGLFGRLAGFQPDDLAKLLVDRSVARATLMRATIHLVTAADALELGGLTRPVVVGKFGGSPFARQLAGADLDGIAAYAQELIEAEPMTRSQLGRLLAARHPDLDETALSYLTFLLPLVQVPPRGLWATPGPAAWTTIEHWLGRPLPDRPDVDAVFVRYLAAFGPATVADMRTWSGLTGLAEVAARLRPQLVTLRDESGRELFDLPDAPRPDADVPAPPRFLPEYDNVLLSYADRARIIEGKRRVPLPPGNGAAMGSLLVDGIWRAMWRLRRSGGVATLTVNPFTALPRADQAAVTEEGLRVLAFVAPQDRAEVRISSPE